MKKIFIDKQIGDSYFDYGFTASFLRKELEGFNDPDNSLEFVIDSPGGSVWEGISIFNVIREFCRENPDVKITSYIQGMAASMASVIALAAKSVNPENKVICEDNSVFMIHNAWCYVAGNHNDLEKEAEDLKSIDGLLRNVYVNVTDKSDKEIEKLMDAESWFYGEEIVSKGFADEVIRGTSEDRDSKGKDENILSAKAEFVRACDSMKPESERNSYREAASILSNLGYKKQNSVSKNNFTVDKSADVEECLMTMDELKASNPALFNEIFTAGKEAGSSEEHDRVLAHLDMAETAGCLDVAAGFIRDGSDVTSRSVQNTYFEKRVANAEKANRVEDNVANIVTPVTSTNEKQDAFMKGFDAALNIKE